MEEVPLYPTVTNSQFPSFLLYIQSSPVQSNLRFPNDNRPEDLSVLSVLSVLPFKGRGHVTHSTQALWAF